VLLVAPFVMLIINQQSHAPYARYAALAIFVVTALSDLLDGVLARRLNQKTRLGAILDPLADKVLLICATVLLALPATCVPGSQLPNWVVVAVVAKDLWVTIGFVVIYLVTDRLRTRPTVTGKACMVAQVLMVGFTLIAPELNSVMTGLGWWTMMASSFVVLGLCALGVMSYTRLGLRFIALEQKPLEDGQDDAPRFQHD